MQGAIYFTVVFEENILTHQQTLPIENKEAAKLIEKFVQGVPVDKRLVYYIMGATGICVTPLCGFHSALQGFRITLLQADDTLRRKTLSLLAQSIKAYIASA